MNTRNRNPILDEALANVPKTIRSSLIASYLEIKKNCLEMRHDAAGIAVGKFCETVLRLLENKITGNYTAFGKKISNFADVCNKLIGSPAASGTESERVILPRALVFLYTMRNKRGIGHIGGDVDANQIDVITMARTADWVLSELIRINHGLSLEEAQDLIDSISIRQLPDIWEVGGKKRILRDGLKARDQTLFLLYSKKDSAVFVEDLCDWIEYCNPHAFKSNVLSTLHKERLIEYDKESESVTLSPKGAKHVEDNIL